MKCRIRKIRAAEPTYYGPDGAAVAWKPMVVEVVVDAPKSVDEAAAQFREVEGWAYPKMVATLICAPTVLELGSATAPGKKEDAALRPCRVESHGANNRCSTHGLIFGDRDLRLLDFCPTGCAAQLKARKT